MILKKINRRQFLGHTAAFLGTGWVNLQAPSTLGLASVSEDLRAANLLATDEVAPVLTSVRRVAQLTGWKDPENKPVINQTTRFGIGGTDLGFSVDFGDRTYFFFGDVVKKCPGDYRDPDCTAYTTAISPNERGLPLTFIVENNQQFSHLTVEGMKSLTTNQTPVGGFSFNGRLFLFVIGESISPLSPSEDCGNSKLRTYLSSTSDPSLGLPFILHYELPCHVLQVAPVIVNNAEWSGLPANNGKGLLLWTQGLDKKVYVAWMPLNQAFPADTYQGVGPVSLMPLWFRTTTGNWSQNPTQAAPLFSIPIFASLSVIWIEQLQHWVMLYATARLFDESHPEEYNQKRALFQVQPIVCRVAPTPWNWSEEMVLFDPNQEAYGHWMHPPRSPEKPLCPAGAIPTYEDWPNGGFAYAPLLIKRYTTWNTDQRAATIWFTLSTNAPYQVMLMQAQLQAGPIWRAWRPITDDVGDPQVSVFSKLTPPVAVARGNQSMHVFVIGNDDRVWTNAWQKGVNGNNWYVWFPITENPNDLRVSTFSNRTPPTAVARGAQNLDLFIIGKDSRIWTNAWQLGLNNDRWLGWFPITDIPQDLTHATFFQMTPPTAVARSAQNLDVFVMGNDSRVWTTAWQAGVNNNQWLSWFPITDIPSDLTRATFSKLTPPVATARSSHNLDVFVIGNDNRLWTTAWQAGVNNNQWLPWFPLADNPLDPTNSTFSNLTPPAVVARSPQNLDVFVIGKDGRIWTNAWQFGLNNNHWLGWLPITDNPVDPAISTFSKKTPPAAIVRGGVIELFVIGKDRRIWQNKNVTPGGPWSGWFPITDNPNNILTSVFSDQTGPAVIARTKRNLDLFVVGDDNRIWRTWWYG